MVRLSNSVLYDTHIYTGHIHTSLGRACEFYTVDFIDVVPRAPCKTVFTNFLFSEQLCEGNGHASAPDFWWLATWVA